MKNVAFVLVALFCTTALAAQYNPAPGAEDLYDLFSPELLAEAGGALSASGPQADAINPAVSGLVQRTTLDASYLGLTGFGSALAGGGWQGHVVNLGVVSPTRAGVFSGSAHFLSMPLAGMEWGTNGFIHASAAKELYPGWIAGLGIRLSAGGLDRFDVGAALDLGLVRDGARLGPFESVRWGVALQNVGKWYVPISSSGALPAPFTPSVSIAFEAYQNDWIRIEAAGSASAPAFQNLRLGAGLEAELFKTVALHAGWKFDLREAIDPALSTRSLIPSFGVSATFRAGLGEEGFAAEQGWTQTEVRTTAGAAPLYNDVWAIGGGVNAPLGIIDTNGPRVAIEYAEPVVISPNNDGTQDALVVPVEITDERFVYGWSFEVRDASGATVREIRNRDDRPENTGFQNIVDRVTAVTTGVPVPETIRWDGRSDTGEVVPDGRYDFLLSAIDDNGNRGTSSSYQVIVDATRPEVAVSLPGDGSRILSPNGDGNKDVLVIDQTGSVEDRWTIEVVNARGIEVWSREIRDGAPGQLVWDGRGNDGIVLPDGIYRYRVSSVDAGGNRAAAELANILLNTEATPVRVTISTSEFSPNADGRKDTVRITPEVESTRGIVDWGLVIRRADGVAVRRITELPAVPEPIDFAGRGDNGALLPEGSYFAEFEARYENGNAPSAQSPVFSIDLTAPRAAVSADLDLFSPNGDGQIDSVTLFQEASREQLWTGTIIDSSDRIVRSFSWSGVPDARFTWNGRQDDGRLAQDGTYRYILAAEDEAGNLGLSTPIAIAIDTTESEIGIRAEFESFSPNADGRLDRQRLFLRVDRSAELDRYTVTVRTATGEVVRRFEGIGSVDPNVVWDGTLENGRRASDGTYTARIDAVLENGIQLSAQTAAFEVDTASPQISLQTPYLLFSPDGDGNRDLLRIAHEATSESEWLATIVSERGDIVREFRSSGRPEDVVWDGTDRAGNAVTDGTYRYEVRSEDRAGNTGEAVLSGIVVDTRLPRLFVTASAPAFSPNGDGVVDGVEFALYANLLDGAEGWTLSIRDGANVLIREFSGNELEAERVIAWDGRDGRGRVREGLFVAEFAASYLKGNEASALSQGVRVDVSAPEVNVDLEPLPFSPDNDGVADELTIGLDVADESPIRAWRFEILDRNNRFFTEFTGRGEPSPRLIWDGRAADGELVISAEDYPYRFTIEDDLGNRTVAEGRIPIDILVVRDGDRLKVQISNITFAPNSPELILDPEDERGAKNLAILQRLAQVFDKYSSYQIRIEGHAVNVTGTEREEREELQPLSLARAETVRRAMIEAGISDRRITTLGRGGTEPIVPHTDLDNRWKNRRVEFILIR
jgi:outer membrane protein OmpA-like peptidoglycan-associated protein/flagellar hook assembly protein FlgD